MLGDYGCKIMLRLTNLNEGTQTQIKNARKKVNDDTSPISVCQRMFLGTLGYSCDEVLRTLQSSTDEAKGGNMTQT